MVRAGDLTGTPPGSATWLGLMVGTAVASDDTGDWLIGTAALNYGMSASGGLDVAFSGIENVDDTCGNRESPKCTRLLPAGA